MFICDKNPQTFHLKIFFKKESLGRQSYAWKSAQNDTFAIKKN